MSNPLLLKPGTPFPVVFHKSQNNKFIFYKMLCLYMEDVNWYFWLSKVLLEIGFFLKPDSSAIYVLAVFIHMILQVEVSPRGSRHYLSAATDAKTI